MLTIFSIPKAFNAHTDFIQQNAIESWQRLHPENQIILMGDEIGTKGVAEKFDVTYVDSIKRNSFGTPLLDSAFSLATNLANHEILCYVNADIILLNDFLDTVCSLKTRAKGQYLGVGQRWDVDIKKRLDFNEIGWQSKLRRKVLFEGRIHPPSGSDIFLFPRDSGLFKDFPPFTIGRPGWDNWLIYHSRRLNIPVIDMTKSVTLIHQNHNYVHVPYGNSKNWEGPEAEINRKLMGRPEHCFSLDDATHFMSSAGNVMPNLASKYLLRRLQTLPILYPVLGNIISTIKSVIKATVLFFLKSKGK